MIQGGSEAAVLWTCASCLETTNERLKRNRASQVVLQFKSAFRDGATHVVMSPLEFMRAIDRSPVRR